MCLFVPRLRVSDPGPRTQDPTIGTTLSILAVRLAFHAVRANGPTRFPKNSPEPDTSSRHSLVHNEEAALHPSDQLFTPVSRTGDPPPFRSRAPSLNVEGPAPCRPSASTRPAAHKLPSSRKRGGNTWTNPLLAGPLFRRLTRPRLAPAHDWRALVLDPAVSWLSA